MEKQGAKALCAQAGGVSHPVRPAGLSAFSMRCDLSDVIAITPATLARTASRPCNTAMIDVLRLTRRVRLLRTVCFK
jgi:hypothetical protein